MDRAWLMETEKTFYIQSMEKKNIGSNNTKHSKKLQFYKCSNTNCAKWKTQGKE